VGRAPPGVMTREVVVYTAEGCSLCTSALEVVHAVQADLGFRLRVVDIGGNPELETQYRERIPVVEIDGERAFEHFVEPHALRARLTG
jgi:glutaredoxin